MCFRDDGWSTVWENWFTGDAGYCYVGALKQGERTFIVALLGCGWPNNKGYKWKDTKHWWSMDFKIWIRECIPKTGQLLYHRWKWDSGKWWYFWCGDGRDKNQNRYAGTAILLKEGETVDIKTDIKTDIKKTLKARPGRRDCRECYILSERF